MKKSKFADLSSYPFKKGDLVVFKHITWNCEGNSGFNSDYLHEVKKIRRASNYLEIKESKCAHSNKRSWGSDGTDIRLAKPEEITARSRLPKTISFTAHNPDGNVVFLKGRNDVLKIKHYTNGNSLLLIDSNGIELEIEIFEIKEANTQEIETGMRQEDNSHLLGEKK